MPNLREIRHKFELAQECTDPTTAITEMRHLIGNINFNVKALNDELGKLREALRLHQLLREEVEGAKLEREASLKPVKVCKPHNSKTSKGKLSPKEQLSITIRGMSKEEIAEMLKSLGVQS